MINPMYFTKGPAWPNIMNMVTYLAKMGSSSEIMPFKSSYYLHFSLVCLVLVAHSKIEGL